MNEDYRPKFTFNITDEQKERADRLITTYGMRKLLFGIILDDVLDLIEEFGGMAIGLIIDKSLKPREALPTLNTVVRKGGDSDGS